MTVLGPIREVWPQMFPPNLQKCAHLEQKLAGTLDQTPGWVHKTERVSMCGATVPQAPHFHGVHFQKPTKFSSQKAKKKITWVPGRGRVREPCWNKPRAFSKTKSCSAVKRLHQSLIDQTVWWELLLVFETYGFSLTPYKVSLHEFFRGTWRSIL